jgi:hypothetical protein
VIACASFRLQAIRNVSIVAVLFATGVGALGAGQEPRTLDFAYYRSKIEPIFLKDRDPDEGAGRPCANCHSKLQTRFRLQPLAADAESWTEEQSRHNFQVVSTLVTPGDPLKSRLLLHPLATDAGGDPSHTGGKFWATQENPEWQTIAEWVKGASMSQDGRE